MTKITETAYPLAWPAGWKRTVSRTRAKFGRGVQQYRTEIKDGRQQQVPSYVSKTSLTIDQATQRVIGELKRFGIANWDIVVSTNLVLRQDGLPKSGQAAPRDPGAAVYWLKGKDSRCMAVDRYDRVQDNLAAIAATLEAMRAIDRHGGAAILDRAFLGFKALAAPEQWWTILGCKQDANKLEIERAFRIKASDAHPDKEGGSHEAMAKLNWARETGLLGLE